MYFSKKKKKIQNDISNWNKNAEEQKKLSSNRVFHKLENNK